MALLWLVGHMEGLVCCRSRDKQVSNSRRDQNQTSAGLQVQGERLVLQGPNRPILRVGITSASKGCSSSKVQGIQFILRPAGYKLVRPRLPTVGRWTAR
jgi:hypothetical protein